jgi:hypothetical protein
MQIVKMEKQYFGMHLRLEGQGGRGGPEWGVYNTVLVEASNGKETFEQAYERAVVSLEAHCDRWITNYDSAVSFRIVEVN